MQLPDAHELKEVYTQRDATAAIQQDGWTLLAVTSVSNPKNMNALCVCYVLGKRKAVESEQSGFGEPILGAGA